MEKLHIIKIGGEIINDDNKLKSFLKDTSKIKERRIIIHGGGKLVDQLSVRLGIGQRMIEGRRITDAETLQMVTMVYAGLINKNIVALMQSNSTNALGLTGADNNCIQATKRAKGSTDYGFVGDIVAGGINSSFLSTLIESNVVPVFCSLTHDNTGQLLNTNADTIAAEIAIAMCDKYDVQLNYCFEQKGVLRNLEDKNSVIETIAIGEFEGLVKKSIISKGMIPKMENAFNAIKCGVQRVVILNSEHLLNNCMENRITGTLLTF